MGKRIQYFTQGKKKTRRSVTQQKELPSAGLREDCPFW